MTLPSFLAASISSGGPKFWATAGPPTAASAAPKTIAPNWRLDTNTAIRFISLVACLSSGPAQARLRAARAARKQVGDADDDRQQRHLYQAERRRDADVAALVVVEQQHGHDHGVARIQE